MAEFITANLGTLIVSLILAVIISAIIFKLISDKKKGKTSCGCNCASCAMSNSCHKNK